MRHVIASPELAHEGDRFLEHVETLVRGRPLRAGHMLIQVLSGPDAQEKTAGHQAGGSRSCVRDDRRMHTDERAGHARAEAELGSDAGDARDHRPDESAVSLIVRPRMDVVGDQAEAQSRLLGELRVADQS